MFFFSLFLNLTLLVMHHFVWDSFSIYTFILLSFLSDRQIETCAKLCSDLFQTAQFVCIISFYSSTTLSSFYSRQKGKHIPPLRCLIAPSQTASLSRWMGISQTIHCTNCQMQRLNMNTPLWQSWEPIFKLGNANGLLDIGVLATFFYLPFKPIDGVFLSLML